MLLINLPTELAKEVVQYCDCGDLYLDLAKNIEGKVILDMLGVYSYYDISTRDDDLWNCIYDICGVEND